MKHMKQEQTKKHPVRRILLVLFALAVVAGGVFSHFGGFGTGKCADTAEFAKYAGAIDDITIPEQARVVALGEATHGNAEFQQLKLDVFKVLVERYGVRGFALEADYGCCEVANRYIHGGEGTAQEAAAATGFAIYRTEQIEQLLSWMRSYNETAAEADQLSFYGFDMQRYEHNYRFLLEAAEDLGIDTTELAKLWDVQTDEFSDAYDADQRAEIIGKVRIELMEQDSPQAAQAVHFADILLQNIELGKVDDYASQGHVLRDRYMADNVFWILAQEEARGNSRIFISAHNGHIERQNTYGDAGKAMGNLLSDQLGDAYFAIGTDFYKASVNLPKGNDGKRSIHTFYSYDALAKASAKCGNEISWLDFSAVPSDSALRQDIDDYGWMGLIGEGYSPIMAILPMAYRIWDAPSELYDGMIFVAQAHPTEIRPLTTT